MSEDHTFCMAVLQAIREETTDPTQQALKLAAMWERSPGCRNAFARREIARQVPMKGKVG